MKKHHLKLKDIPSMVIDSIREAQQSLKEKANNITDMVEKEYNSSSLAAEILTRETELLYLKADLIASWLMRHFPLDEVNKSGDDNE